MYGNATLAARMADKHGTKYDICITPYTIDVWQHVNDTYGGTRLYMMYMDMTIHEVITQLAMDFGFIEIVNADVL